MTTIEQYRQYGEDIEKMLLLKTSPIAVKMLRSEDEIPEGTYRPKRDDGVHYAQCQVFALNRKQRRTIALLKEDQWCWAPLVGYGLVEKPDPETVFGAEFPCFERDEYIGTISGPLNGATFEPDVVLIYSNTAQLRHILSAVKTRENPRVKSEFDPIDSCIYSVVVPIQNGEYRITLPDPGEFERGMAGEDEIIFSVPKERVPTVVEGLHRSYDANRGYVRSAPDISPDLARPGFYKKLFSQWGLDVEPRKQKYDSSGK